MFNDALVAVFLLCVTIQVAYALYFYLQIFRLPFASHIIADKEAVSVIICAKNEAANLQRNLPAIMAQRYANDAGIAMYSVIVVNDVSTDDTPAVLAAMQQQYPNLQVITISHAEQRNLPGKKYALSKGIAAAKHDIILVTDADCTPASENWLQSMVAPLQNGKEITAGYGKYTEGPGLLNAFIRWETLHTFLQYSTYTMTGSPYMATGRNLAYRKAALLKAQLSPEWAALPSGDDDLLIRAAANKNNMAIVADKDAITLSDAKATWGEWVSQKQRHVSTGKYYKTGIKLLLGGYGLSHTIVWLAFILVTLTGNYETALVAMLCRCFIYWMIMGQAAKLLDEKSLIKWLPLMDIGWMLYNFAFSPYILWKNKRQWK